MSAYYNEIDPFAAQWLRNLIAAGHIAPGEVDERSIEDIQPDELRGFTQCHFFAGIGIWSGGLRAKGWADDRPIWTGSCPCQPFSAAGKGNGFADERHLWPAFFHLIGECRPTEVIGEQVASKDGLAWLELVQADMEASGYAFGAFDLSAAGFASPEITGRMGGAHIRQRTYWGARRLENAQLPKKQRQRQHGGEDICQQETNGPAGASLVGWPGNGNNSGLLRGKDSGGMADAHRAGRIEGIGNDSALGHGKAASSDSVALCMADAESHRHERRGEFSEPAGRPCATHGGAVGGVDWIPCRDGKWRPVESTLFKVVDEDSGRLVFLRPGERQETERLVGELAERQSSTPAQILRKVLGPDGPKSLGEPISVYQAQVLLSGLLQHERETWNQQNSGDGSSERAPAGCLRVLRQDGAIGNTPHQRGLARRTGREYADAVRLVSSAVARAAQEAGVEMLSADAAASRPASIDVFKNRVGQLRAFGNALDKATAEAFIEAWMECAP